MRKPALHALILAQTVALGLLSGSLAGCSLFRGAVLLWGKEPTREVPAEYPYLAGKKVCILVWAEPYTLFEYPHVQLDVSEYVRVALAEAVDHISIQPNRPVVEYQAANPDWDKEDAAKIGSRFGGRPRPDDRADAVHDA